MRQVLEALRRLGDYFVGGWLPNRRRGGGLPLCRRILESFHFVGHPVLLVMIRSDLYILQSLRFTYLCACAWAQLYSCCCEQLIVEWRGNGGERRDCYVVVIVSRHHVAQGSA